MLVIASDHGGFALKQELLGKLREMGLEFEDLGCFDTASVDYPVYAEKVCRAVQEGKAAQGVLVCGTGIGMSMAANKYRGIRAAVISDCFSAKMTRLHNDANVLCLGGRTVGPELAKLILEIFVTTPFSGEEKHSRRVGMIKELEG